jgi:hypothetical protein
MPEHRPAADEALHRTEKVQVAFLTLVCWVWIVALVFRDRLGGVQAILAALMCVPMNWGLTRLVRGGSALFAEKFVGGVLQGAGNIKRQHEFSKQESLIARGRFDEAVESFRLHLMEFPDDIPARYRLATLHLRERNDPVSAEAELLKLRQRPHDRSMAMLLANHFVDLYRATGQQGKLMAELTKMIKEWPGTPMAEGAAKLLEETRRDRLLAGGGVSGTETQDGPSP